MNICTKIRFSYSFMIQFIVLLLNTSFNFYNLQILFLEKKQITMNNLYIKTVMRNGKIVWKLTPLYRILTTNFNFCRWSSTTCKSSHKHGVGARGILASGWLWSYFRYHQVWFLRIWGLIQRDMNLAVEKIPTINNSSSCPCSFCAKVFLFKRWTHQAYEH